MILKDNNKIIRDQKEVAETLNKFFTGFENAERESGVKCAPDLTHIQQNLPSKSALFLKKTNSIEVN